MHSYLGALTCRFKTVLVAILFSGAKIVSEYDQEIPQSQTADNPVAPRGRAAQPSQDTMKTKPFIQFWSTALGGTFV